MKNKKGQLGGLVPIVTTLIVVGLLIGAGFLIVEKFRDQDSLSDTSVTLINETGGLNQTGHYLAGRAYTAANSFVIDLVVINASTVGFTPHTLLAGNYSVTSDGILTNVTVQDNATEWEDMNVSYTFKHGDIAYKGVNDSLEAMRTVPDLLGLIILILLVGIILAIVFNVIPTGRVSGA